MLLSKIKQMPEAEWKRYKAFLHGDIGQCCLTGRADIQLAHAGDVTTGKGMGIKCPHYQVLPLSHALHLAEEADRQTFWANALPGEDHLAWAERLYECFVNAERADALDLIADMQEAANRSYLASILAVAA
jgi:hypothetical protein